MRKAIFILVIFTSVSFCLNVKVADAQMAYGSSFVRANIYTRIVDGHSSTWLDYYTGYYYDPEVIGDLYRADHPETSLDYGGDIGYSSLIPAQVFLFTNSFAEGKIYCTYSQHYMRGAFYFPATNLRFDPYNFTSLNNPDGGPWEGFPFSQNFVTPRRIYLGWTQACVLSPTTPTPTPTPPTPTPTPTPCLDDVGENCLPVRLAIGASPVGIRPSGVRGGTNRAGIGVCAYNPNTGNNIPNVDIRLKLKKTSLVTNTGGHIDESHIGNRPLGRLARTRLRTGSDGCAATLYSPSHIAGLVGIEATASRAAARTHIGVYVPNLYILSDGENYNLIGGRPWHPSNHWGTQRSVNALIRIANAYKRHYYGNDPIPEQDKLHFNDISLEWGGKFNINKNWSPAGSHSEHREGINVDVRCCRSPGLVPRSRWAVLNEIFTNNGSNRTLDETGSSMPHWHLRFESYLAQEEFPHILNGIEQTPESFGEVNPAPVSTHYFVEYAWWSVFDREAVQEEWENWHNRLTFAKAQGTPEFLAEVRAFEIEMFSASEYTARHRTYEEFVADVFESHLLRQPTSEETDYWVNYLQNLPPSLPQNRRFARLLSEFAAGSEFEEAVLRIVDEDDAPPAPTPTP